MFQVIPKIGVFLILVVNKLRVAKKNLVKMFDCCIRELGFFDQMIKVRSRRDLAKNERFSLVFSDFERLVIGRRGKFSHLLLQNYVNILHMKVVGLF